MPDTANTGLVQCEDCGHHFQVSPRGEVQLGACPDCGGKRMFRMQSNPVQSEGTLRNMVDMETGKDAGGNPDGEGILAPPSGRAILTAFAGEEMECPTCHLHTNEMHCPRCGTFIDPTAIASEHSGVPAELRPQIPGAPLTEGTIMDADHTDPLDTGAHGRDEYTHGSVLRVLAAEGEHQGYTNWETWHTKLMLDNDRHLHEHQKKMSEEGWTPDQIRDWTTKHVIGPENKRKLEDAQEWNEIPEPERTDPHYEEVAEKSPQHKDIMESWFGGPDLSDSTPNLIDPELVNWDEIHHNIHAEHDEEQQYGEEDRRLKGEGLTHGMPGHTDETNKMLDAWMKHHGVPDEGGSPYDNPIHVPIEHLEKGYGQYRYPQDFGEPHAAEIAQQGDWNEPIRDLGWHTLHRIHNGLETPYAATMQHALEGQGYPPEQVQHIMAPTHGWNEDEQRFLPLKPPEEKGPDPRLDQPGKDVFPTEWTSAIVALAGHWEDFGDYGEQIYRKTDPADNLRCPQCHEQAMFDRGQAEAAFCPNCNYEWPIHRDEPQGGRHHQYPAELQELAERGDRMTPQTMDFGPVHQGRTITAGVCPECGKSTSVYPNGAVACNNYLCGKHWGPDGKEIDHRAEPATEPPGPVKAFTPYTAGETDGVTFTDTPAQQNNFLRWTPGMYGGGLVIAGQPHTWNMRDSEGQSIGPGHGQYPQSLGIDRQHVDWSTGVDIGPNGELKDEYKRKDLTPFIAADPRLKQVEEKTPSGPTMANHSRTNNMEPYETLWVHEADVPSVPEPESLRIAGLWGDLGTAALGAGIGAGAVLLAPETGGASLAGGAALEGGLIGGGEAAAAGAGAAAAGGEAAGAAAGAGESAGVGGLMKGALGKGTKALGIQNALGMGEHALGVGGGGGGEGGGAAPYNGPLQQFAGVLGAFVESDYETPSSVPDVGVKHDDPEDVDQKEFNDQDKSPENPLNPNLQDSGASGEDEVRDNAGKPSQGQFTPESPAIQRMEMLMPLIEKYYHSDESGADDPMIKQLHEELETENPGYLNQADDQFAERYMQNKKKPEHVHAKTADWQYDHDKICPKCQSPMQRRGAAGLTNMHPNGAWECTNQRCWHMIPGDEQQQLDPQHPDPMMDNEPGTLTIPEHWSGTVHEAIMPPMQQGNLNAQQQVLDPTGLNPSLQPSSQTPPGGAAQQGHCAHCGGVTGPDGSCPQCGAAGATPAAPLPGGPSQIPHPQTFAHTDLLASLVDSANHQGPVTPEQIASVQQYLIQEGRVDEVPNVPMDPGNPEYAKILAEIQNNPIVPPTVTPEQQTQPPPPQPAAPGGMPVPGMAPGEAGGRPMQPMSSFLPEILSWDEDPDNESDLERRLREAECPKCGGLEPGEASGSADVCSCDPPFHRRKKTAADNIAPRCPKCGSGTTGVIGDEDHHARCHACQNVWKMEGLLHDGDVGGETSRLALHDDRPYGGQGEQANPVGVPAAEQAQQINQGGDEDSSMTWEDTAGAPLRAGQTYQMINPSYSLPDLVRVERVKPDGLDVTLLGTFANDPSQADPNSLTSSTPISKEDADLQQLSFEPVNQTADDQGHEPPPGSAAPGNAQVPPSGQTTDEQAASEPQMAAHSSIEHDPDCPRCGHMEFTSSMITPEATEHSCYRCGHDWVTEEKDNTGLAQREGWTNPNAEWLNEDDDAEDFLAGRREGMMQAAVQSRSLADVAEKDERLRAVHEHLTREGAERQQRLAGKHFTPREQRELIDEDGMARNGDLLELEGTHYTGRYDESGKANGENVRDADLFLGL